jgi:cytochrome c2
VGGDAANGELLFNTFQADVGFACATCHRADSEERLIGPGLLNIGVQAATRVNAVWMLSSISAPRLSIPALT